MNVNRIWGVTWLAGLSRGGAEHGHGKTSKPRNSNAEDRRLIAQSSQIGRDSCASADEGLEAMGSDVGSQEGEMKKIDCGESFLRTNSPVDGLRSVSVRDMGTEMTPASSLKPSRTATPIRVATIPSLKSTPICSRSSTPRRPRHGGHEVNSYHLGHSSLEGRNEEWVLEGRRRMVVGRKRGEPALWKAGPWLGMKQSVPNTLPGDFTIDC